MASTAKNKRGNMVVFSSVMDSTVAKQRPKRRMYYSDDEIRGLFRGALDPVGQIHVLAELNAVDDDVMREYLIQIGCIRSSEGEREPGTRSLNIVHHDNSPGYHRRGKLN